MYLHFPNLEHLAPATLLAYAGNSREHPPEQIQEIAASIREFGFTRVVLIDENNMILAGHGATMAALSLELESVPCRRIVGLPDAKKAAYVIADNALGLKSRWDNDKLRGEIEALQAIDFDLSLTGLDFDAIDKLLGSVGEPETVDFSGSEDESQSGNPVPTLKFGKYKIEMTDEEVKDLGERVDAHVQKYGSYHGFVARLLACLMWILLLPSCDGPAPAATPRPRSTWYVEILRGGEHVTTYLCAEEPRLYIQGVCEFTTIEGEHVETSAPVIIKKRKP